MDVTLRVWADFRNLDVLDVKDVLSVLRPICLYLLQVPQDVVLSIVQHIEGSRRDGVVINGEKYMFLRTLETDGIKYAMFKCKQDGLSCALGNKCEYPGLKYPGL